MPVAASAVVDIRADANWADAQSAAAHWADALDGDLPPVDLDDRDDHPHRGGPDDHPHQDDPDGHLPRVDWAGPAERPHPDDPDGHPLPDGSDDHPHQDGLDACPPSDLPAGTACCLAVSAC